VAVYNIGGNEDPPREGERPDLKDKVTVPDVLLQPIPARSLEPSTAPRQIPPNTASRQLRELIQQSRKLLLKIE